MKKLSLFKKIGLSLVGVSALVVGIGSSLPEEIPDDLKLKTQKENIITFWKEDSFVCNDVNNIINTSTSTKVVKTNNCIKNGNQIRYKYRSNIEVESFEGEDISKRTKNSITFNKNNNQYTTRIFTGEPFEVGDDGKWYYTKTSTTTIDAFDSQTVGFLDKLVDIAYGATETLRPTGAGDETNISNVTGAATHWEAVDEAVADDATTTVYHNIDSASARDLYALANSSIGAGTINKITVFIRGEGATAWFKSAIKEGGTITESAQFSSSADDTFETKSTDYLVNPRTGSAWQWSEIDSLQVGAVSYRDPAQQGRITQVYIEVDYTGTTSVGEENIIIFE